MQRGAKQACYLTSVVAISAKHQLKTENDSATQIAETATNTRFLSDADKGVSNVEHEQRLCRLLVATPTEQKSK
jgi:hypothetical protein